MSKTLGTTLSLLALTLLPASAVISSSYESGLPEDLASLQHVNSLVVPDTDSPIHGIHHFYANQSAVKTLRTGTSDGAYPDGSVFVGAVFALERSKDGQYIMEGKREAYTVMRKASTDQATSETGGWHFAMFTATGEKMDIDPVKDCFGCHRPHAGTDFVMSELLALPPDSR